MQAPLQQGRHAVCLNCKSSKLPIEVRGAKLVFAVCQSRSSKVCHARRLLSSEQSVQKPVAAHRTCGLLLLIMMGPTDSHHPLTRSELAVFTL